MSEEDGPEQVFSDNYYSDKSPSEHQGSPENVLGKVKEDRNVKENRQSNIKTQFIPSVAVPEKIVICIDTSLDSALGYTSSISNKSTETQTVLIEALRVFFINKLSIAKDTKFALASMKSGNAELLSHFTSNVNHLMKSLSDIKGGANEDNMADYDISGLFDICTSIELPDNPKSKQVPPEFVVRVIFIYNNSHRIPRMNEVAQFYAKFLNSPHCIFDVVYMHEAQSDFNSVVKIYEQLGKIVSQRSYLLECSRNVTIVFNTFAKLLAHPYQRVSQDLWEF